MVALFVFAWFAVRFQLGDLFSEVASPADADASAIADAAIALAPTNPRSYWLKGAAERSRFDQDSAAAVVNFFTRAARSGAYDYRWWTELGRANEQAGDFEPAECAYSRAVELAPEYTTPRWQLGNFYLRRGRNEEAIEQLRIAAEHSKLYRGQVYAIAWNFFGRDPKFVEQFANESAESRASLALFYASQNEPEHAIRNWNLIGADDKERFSRDAETAARLLINHRSYAGALEFSRQSGTDPSARPGAVTNGNFESGIRQRDQPMFDWSIGRRDPKADIALDTRVKRSGQRSLRVTFRNYEAPWLESISQTVVLVPGVRYRLKYSYRTEGIRGGSLPRLEVLSAINNSSVANSPAFDQEAGIWHEAAVEFTAEEKLDGYVLKIGREPCAGECPLIGTLWLDDLELSQI